MRFKLTVFGWFITCWLYSQNEGLKFRNYGIHQGLSQSSILSIYQDRKGFLWFGTSDGLNQFDGYQFKIYKNSYLNNNSLSDNWIGGTFEDSDNELWVLTVDKTLNRLNLRTQEITRYAINKICPPECGQVNMVFFVKEDHQKNIWISSNAGIFRFNKKLKKFEFFDKAKDCPTNLKGNNVYQIFEDHSGILWFTSNQGLFNYNNTSGKFIRYKHQVNNEKSILSNEIISVFTDKLNRIWVLNSLGLNIYQSDKNSFTGFPFPKKVKFDIPGKFRSGLVDRNGLIWIGTKTGLYKFDTETYKYYYFENDPSNLKSLSDNYISRIYEDFQGNIWIGTSHGLNRYNSAENNFETYFPNSQIAENDFISNILEDRNKDILVTGKYGPDQSSTLSYLNKCTGKLEVQLNDKSNPGSIACSSVYQPFKDNTGSIWFCSFSDGIIQYVPRTTMFENYVAKPGDPDFLNGNSVWGFAEDHSGNIYIPLFYNGLDIFNPQSKKFIHLGPKNNQLLSNCLCSIAAGIDNDIWIGAEENGIIRYHPSTGKFTQYKNIANNLNSISKSTVRQIIVEPAGNLWIAFNGGGMDYFNPVTETATHFRNDPNNKNSLANDNVWALLRDRNGNIWISCDGFIDKYNPATKKFTHYKSKSTDFTGIIANKALTMFEDSKGNIWFGTSGGGLSMLNLKTNRFRHWTETEGLPNNVVYGILEDDEGHLWLSTNRGLSRFDIKTNNFRNYYESDGLQSNEFNMGSYYKSRDHKLYFGGINGFDSFYPKNITLDTTSLNTVVTGLQIFNKEIPVIPPDKRDRINQSDSAQIIRLNNNLFLPQDITYANSVTLTYREKVFTLEYAALSFIAPERTVYRYKMENFDADWNAAGNRRYATYTNLPPGKYIFKVMAANTSGIWNSRPTILNIRILPPFWQTWWFLLFEGIFIFGMVILVIKLRVMSLNHAKKALEKKVYERTHEIKEKNEELELRNIQIIKQKEEIAFQAQQLKTELTSQNQTSELALLRSQINPHFLFNTLNNIYSLVYQRSDNAPEAVMKLSEIMRYMLYEATSEKVLLKNEINYLNSFIDLQMLRIKNREFVSFNITGNFENRTIAPMLLIAFVENAFKHGVKRGNNPGITINLDIMDNKINFEVINYCKKNEPSNKDMTGGIGLVNISRRLELLFPNKFILNIMNQDDIYHVKLQLEE